MLKTRRKRKKKKRRKKREKKKKEGKMSKSIIVNPLTVSTLSNARKAGDY